MSLSNPSKRSPVTKYIEWAGSKGQFYFYNKDPQKNEYFDKPLYIIPLDELVVIKGYHDASNSGIYSNEVKFLSKENLIVKSFKGGMIASGLYNDIKGKLEGGKFGKSIYSALISSDGKSVELVNFQLHGSALGSFIDAKINVDSGNVVSLSPSADELKKGATVYFSPKIKKHEIRKDILKLCIEMDKELQKYLSGYLNDSENKEIIEDTKAIEATKQDKNNDLPF